jgi:hypothetical protein
MVFIVETSHVSFAPTTRAAKNLSLRHEVLRRPLKLKETTNKKCEQTTEAPPPKINDFAFIVNRHPFPNPHVVHVSRVSKTRKENLDCFKPNVICTPQSMDFILKPLLHNEESFNFHGQFKGCNTNSHSSYDGIRMRTRWCHS